MRSNGHSRKLRNKFVWFMKVPFKALGKARDFYVGSLTSCASRINYGQCPVHFLGQYYGLPMSFSKSSPATSNVEEEDDLTELITAASVRNSGHGNEMEVFLPKHLRLKMRSRGLPKNMGRIDEDKPCEFEENDVVFEMKSKFGIKSQYQQPISVHISRV